MQTDELFLKGDELYEKGDFAGAFAAFMQAAMEGDTSCMLRVAVMYTCGEGVNCDYDKAIEWELKAVEGGEISALVNLGISFRIKGDIRKAKHWFERAIESGDGSGALELAKLYLVSPKENERTIEYLKLAISSKNMCEVEVEEAQKLLSELEA
ncbi:tetratricopeptide repeat protein [Chitinilyticum litopenaei]|uniref:tetratricopeptide repeat protein n=1 Tax=Chitinilyticum litopenaei TaxID=1121276 RepID=UPI0005BBB0AC|nr:SEL1-like repeat protein [Chitinilyticum litopenaei]